MMRRFTGRVVVMVLAGIFFFGSSLGWSMLSPDVAEAAVAKAPEKKKALPHLAKASQTPQIKKILAKKSKKIRYAESGGKGRTGKRVAKVVCQRCEPQSLTYARQRSGIMTSRNGRENGPLTWLASEKKSGRTTAEPTAGSVLILGAQGHGMATGHVAYVEKVSPMGPSTYRVVFSHTNYDRQCHLETDIEALYNRETMTLDIHSGAWKSWGRGLKVAGFIRGI